MIHTHYAACVAALASWLFRLSSSYGGVPLGRYTLRSRDPEPAFLASPEGKGVRIKTPGFWLEDEHGKQLDLLWIWVGIEGRVLLAHTDQRQPELTITTEDIDVDLR